MGSSPPLISIGKTDMLERAIRRIYGDGTANRQAARLENTTALVEYLFKSGINDEDELVELAMLADGKRYDPVAGVFD